MANQIVNVEQAEAWDGPDGEYWAAHQARFDSTIGPHHAQLMAAAAIAPGERVLDIGCGNGLTSRDAARAAGERGEVLGVDLSGPMLVRVTPGRSSPTPVSPMSPSPGRSIRSGSGPTLTTPTASSAGSTSS
jgi:2-polyprenyl-3-methyl-5-hydroxy-6-metoxy-1,4-benzoquinol methylase